MVCESRSVPSVVATTAWVSPRVKMAEPWARGSTPVRISMARTVRVSRPSMRGSPARIWSRTILASMSNSIESTLTESTLVSSVASAAFTSAVATRRACVRACLLRIWYAASILVWARPPILAISASSLAGSAHSPVSSHSGLPASRTSSWIALMAILPWSWPKTTAPSMMSSGSWSASDSTISTAASVPATTRSSFEFRRSVLPGFRTYSPLT